MEYRLPQINMFTRDEWDWPFLKFNLKREDLFTTLHDRFNMHRLPLQDPMAFHRDVCEAVAYSGTLEEFYSQMEERKAQRAKEMNKAWDDICFLIASGPWVLACPLCYDAETGDVKTPPDTLNDSMPQKWALFNYFSRSLSFDTLIRYFDGYVRDRRKKVEDRERRADERLARLMRQAAAKRAASAAVDATKAAPQTPPKAAHHQPKTSHDASTSYPPSDRSRRSSTRRRHEKATHPSTTANPTTQKRRSDEDTRGPQRKRRRTRSESAGEDDDAVWIAAEHDSWEAEEPAPTPRHAAKRERTDDHPDERGNKRSKRYVSSQEDDSEHLHYHSSPDERENEWLRPFSDAEEENEFLHHYDSLDEQEGQTSSHENTEGRAANDTTDEAADAKKHMTKPRALRRQRVERRRSRTESEMSPPKEQPRQKKRQERKSVEQLLQSKRSSRRTAGQPLFFLDDNATPCVAGVKRRIRRR
ncbi:hypothetical protein BBK36DRAFT_1175723 [Trichoderma citrinoviride]|uniref:Uncharacterized protein n=1 Tax=Trichoderma citrinoviride TaxID=58853 RepID=A0A2T4BNE6_9HYPO|nr:hypothetical protein BBK36DRAFT_1175723 [Trichoderma citrinoviride]PTB70838.1 hypothetical protein BBK36DRAFT_1175723 [Trichoderma citrinoviride]